MPVLRCKADRSYILAVARDGCSNGGRAELIREPGIFGQWDLHENVLRSRVNPNFVLSVPPDGCSFYGQVQMWEYGDKVDDSGQWIWSGNSLRSKVNAGFVLAARRDFWGLHMWSYDGLPDEYGQWEMEDSLDMPRQLSGDSRKDSLDMSRQISETGGILSPVVSLLKSALVMNGESVVSDIKNEPFLRAMESLVFALDRIGWHVGTALFEMDTDKLRRSIARNSGTTSYSQLLLSDLAVNAATGYQEYADDSSAIANLWLARRLDFLAQMFSLLQEGHDTSESADAAYARTMQSHCTFIQRQAFLLFVAQLPAQRQELLKQLQGDVPVGISVVLLELAACVDLVRLTVAFCFEQDRGLEGRLRSRSEQMEMDEGYGRA
eukprot:TRINITY_DN3354_c0_g1_i1.p1 TRINITY_DN3354_c0_g1~~TRINITY_DN3354_c0_g1_i1.p1  ORF type:complete len:394 (-),score=50.21 TRINITY_DN3354_c0_g1_i1:195-1331(-)